MTPDELALMRREEARWRCPVCGDLDCEEHTCEACGASCEPDDDGLCGLCARGGDASW